MRLLIIGYYLGKKEVLDSATNWIEGYKLLKEYKLAYGLQWNITLVQDIGGLNENQNH